MLDSGDRPIPTVWLERAALALRVLTHPHRLRICEALLRRDASVGELATALGLRQSVVSQHLSDLRMHGIVTPQRRGRTVHYRVIHPAPGWLLTCIRRQVSADDESAAAFGESGSENLAQEHDP